MEKTITNSIIKKLNCNPDIWIRKRFASGMSSNKGFPDITGVIKVQQRAIHIEIEIKRPGKLPTNIQFSRLRKFRKFGAIAFWCDSLVSCEKQLNYWQQLINQGNTDFTDYTDLSPRGAQFIMPSSLIR